MRKREIIEAMGYNLKLDTKDIVEKLEAKGTKAAAKVAEKIKESPKYDIYASPEMVFAIDTEYRRTAQEFIQLGNVLKGEVRCAGNEAEANDMWIDWIEATE
jgi:hypothetical protein